MANFISLSVWSRDGKTLGSYTGSGASLNAIGQEMGFNTEHIIYGTNKEYALTDVTAASDAAETITIVAHGLAINDRILFRDSGDGTPSNVTAELIYAVIEVPTVDTIKISTSEAGSGVGIGANFTDTCKAFKVRGIVKYADRMSSARPVDIETVETCSGTPAISIAALSNQLMSVNVETKNGVSTGTTVENMMINLDRAILVYEDGSGSNDFWMWYDASNTNHAGFDSPFVDFLQINEDFGDGTTVTYFIDHIGGKGGPESLLSLTVNGNTVSFPDVSASGLLRLKNVISAYESGGDTYLLMKGSGKNGLDTLVIDDSLSNVVGSTEASQTT
jgi:hypothetical protein